MSSISKSALTALAVAFAVCAVSASSALAAPEWYTASPEWRQAGASLTEPAATVWHGKVTVTESNVGAIVECTDSAEGTVGPGAVGTETHVTMSSCVSVGSECKSPTVTAVALPWHTELALSGGLRDVITGSGGSKTGYTLKCTVLGIPYSSTCSGSSSAGLSDVSGGVEAALSGKSFTCTSSGKSTGSIEGSQLLEASKGGKLEAVPGGNYVKLTSPAEVSSTGELKVEDKGFSSLGMTCKFVTKGTIEPLGLGKINSFVAESCSKGTGGCSTVERVEPVHLPWKTEAYESEGTIRDRIVSGGTGTPAWSFECNVAGSKYEDTCNLNVSPHLQNVLSGVEAIFSEVWTPTTCSKGGKGVWTGSLILSPPAGAGAVAIKS